MVLDYFRVAVLTRDKTRLWKVGWFEFRDGSKVCHILSFCFVVREERRHRLWVMFFSFCFEIESLRSNIDHILLEKSKTWKHRKTKGLHVGAVIRHVLMIIKYIPELSVIHFRRCVNVRRSSKWLQLSLSIQSSDIYSINKSNKQSLSVGFSYGSLMTLKNALFKS